MTLFSSRGSVVTQVVVSCSMLFAFFGSTEAQQRKKIPQIGYFTLAYLSTISERIRAFQEGLRDHGYVEGKNIIIKWRGGDKENSRTGALATELVHEKPDLIVTAGSGATRPVKQATLTIPIVMTQDDDPVANGFVASLARPGGNITGLSTLAPEISGKRLDLLKEISPKAARLAVFGTSTSAANAKSVKEMQVAAEAMKVQLHYIDVVGPDGFETAFQAANKARVEAIILLVSGHLVAQRRKEIAELAIKTRLPVIYERREHVIAGGLVSYGVALTDLDRRAATYVDKILKGANPADLPIEQPSKFELVINFKAAKQIGLVIPPNVLARADRVIR